MSSKGKSDVDPRLAKGAAALKNAMGDKAYDAHKHGDSLKGAFFNKDGRVSTNMGLQSEDAQKEALQR